VARKDICAKGHLVASIRRLDGGGGGTTGQAVACTQGAEDRQFRRHLALTPRPSSRSACRLRNMCAVSTSPTCDFASPWSSPSHRRRRGCACHLSELHHLSRPRATLGEKVSKPRFSSRIGTGQVGQLFASLGGKECAARQTETSASAGTPRLPLLSQSAKVPHPIPPPRRAAGPTGRNR
jgi:hypothetical protein